MTVNCYNLLGFITQYTKMFIGLSADNNSSYRLYNNTEVRLGALVNLKYSKQEMFRYRHFQHAVCGLYVSCE